MKARRLLEGATFDPAQMKAIGQAFDGAWEKVSPRVSARAEAIEAARYKLAQLVLSVAKRGILDPEKLKDETLRLMQEAPTEP